MKTIEERAQELANKSRYWTPGGAFEVRIDFFSDALTELAVDLNAKHEETKVNWRQSESQWVGREREWTDAASKYEKEVSELRAWKESALKVMPDFQKLGKLLGLPLGSGVSEQLVHAVEQLTKEVSELREKLAAIEAGSDIQNLSVSSHFELDCGPIKTEPALLDEVKRVLGDLTNRLEHSLTGDLGGAVEQELTEVKETVDQLLTRLLP